MTSGTPTVAMATAGSAAPKPSVSDTTDQAPPAAQANVVRPAVGSNEWFRGQCFYCGKSGHNIHNCPMQMEDVRNGCRKTPDESKMLRLQMRHQAEIEELERTGHLPSSKKQKLNRGTNQNSGRDPDQRDNYRGNNYRQTDSGGHGDTRSTYRQHDSGGHGDTRSIYRQHDSGSHGDTRNIYRQNDSGRHGDTRDRYLTYPSNDQRPRDQTGQNHDQPGQQRRDHDRQRSPPRSDHGYGRSPPRNEQHRDRSRSPPRPRSYLTERQGDAYRDPFQGPQSYFMKNQGRDYANSGRQLNNYDYGIDRNQARAHNKRDKGGSRDQARQYNEYDQGNHRNQARANQISYPPFVRHYDLPKSEQGQRDRKRTRSEIRHDEARPSPDE
jgi:hypothetical protein